MPLGKMSNPFKLHWLQGWSFQIVLMEGKVKIEGYGFGILSPDGAMYIFARTRKQINTTELSEKLLEQGLAIAPGIGFGDYNEFFRISACLDIKMLTEGMNILQTQL